MKLFFANLPVGLLALALLLGWISARRGGARTNAEELFRYVALVAIFPGGLMAFLTHAFAPQLSASAIGWPVSPFQWEVAVANLSVALLGLFSFRASRGFRAATVLAICCWHWGAAIGHVQQMLEAGNFNPGNAGIWLWLDLGVPALMVLLFVKMRQGQSARAQEAGKRAA